VTLTFDSLGRAVEQLKNAAYTQILYGPTGEKLALMSGQTLQRAFVALPAGASAVYTASGLDHYQHTDWLGSARLTSTPTRTVSGDTAYAPFGETYAQSGAPDLSFTGQNQDTAGGLYDFLYREFSTQGRWHSPDPAGLAAISWEDPQSLNRYAYARNMPDMLTDPLGLCPECRYAPASSSFQAPTCYLEGVQISCTLLARINDAGASYLVFPGYKYKGTLDSGTNCYVGVVVDDAFCLGDHSTFSFRDNSNSGGSGNGDAVRAAPKLMFEPPNWHGFVHKFLPCYAGQLLGNFVGDKGKAAVTAGTVAALKLKNPWAAGAALVVWTGINTFKAGAECAVSSRAVYE
jgi:RHS repeat-associated protein